MEDVLKSRSSTAATVQVVQNDLRLAQAVSCFQDLYG